MDNLLGELLGGDGGGTRGGLLSKPSKSAAGDCSRARAVSGEGSRARVVTSGSGGVKAGLSYSQAALSPVSEECAALPQSSSDSGIHLDKGWVVVSKGGSKRKLKGLGRSSSGSSSSTSVSARPGLLQNAKRRRSPESPNQPCSRCFRVGHRADECRHLIVCLRCSRAGHTASSCHLSPRAKNGDGSRCNSHGNSHRLGRGSSSGELKWQNEQVAERAGRSSTHVVRYRLDPRRPCLASLNLLHCQDPVGTYLFLSLFPWISSVRNRSLVMWWWPLSSQDSSRLTSCWRFSLLSCPSSRLARLLVSVMVLCFSNARGRR